MKYLTTILTFTFCLSSWAVDLKFDLTDFALNPATNRTVWVTAMSVPTAGSASVVIGGKIISTTDSSGVFYISNVTANLYSCQVQGPPSRTDRTDFMVLIQSTDSGLINAHSNMVAASTATFPAGSVAWSAASQNLRFAAAGSGGGSATNVVSRPGSNVQITTNSASDFTYSTVTNPVFTTLIQSNPAAGGSSSQFIISGNTGSGGFSDLLTSDPAAFSITPGGSRPFRVPKLLISGTGSSAMVGDASGLTNLPAASLNPNTQIYSSTGLYCSIIITNNQYTLSGASGVRTNSNNVSVDFSQANGTYGWCATCKGNGEDGVTNIGILTNSASPNWVCSYQWFGASFPTWVFYNTNVWIYTSSGATKTNVVLATGLPAPLGKSPGGGREDYLPDLMTSNFWKYLPSAIPSTVSFAPVYTTNIFPIAASVYDPVDGLVKFPNVGPSQTSVRRANVDPPNQNYPADPGIILVRGAGVIQRMEIMVSQFSPGQYRSNYWLQLFPDYGNNSTAFASVNSNLMTFNVPITQLSSTRLDNPNGIGGLIGNSWSTAFWDVQTDGFVPFIKICLKLKCPFTNNFFARVIDVAANSEAGGSFFSTVDYQIDPTGQLNYPFRDWRLHGVNARYPVATITPKLDGIQTDWSQTQITMFTETNKAGVVIALLGGLSGLGNGPMETANWEWICDGAYPPFQMEGEDVFFAPYEAWIPAPFLNLTHGLNNRLGPLFQNPTDFDAYRIDYQVAWQHDIKAILTSAPGTYGDITTIYYAH